MSGPKQPISLEAQLSPKEATGGFREVISSISEAELEQRLHPSFEEGVHNGLVRLTAGTPGSPGVASGQVVFHREDLERLPEAGQHSILVCNATRAHDINIMQRVSGIVTVEGGITSHAAIVARGIGKPCVVGAGNLHIERRLGRISFGEQRIYSGDWITIDGASGIIYSGRARIRRPLSTDLLHPLIAACKAISLWKIRVNAETEQDLDIANKFGADGIGVCRTEHMFLGEGRIELLWQMIAGSGRTQPRVSNLLFERQRLDFEAILRKMSDRPVTIRLLDPPLHEFLPRTDEELEKMALIIGERVANVKRLIGSMAEENPMLGHRGCRLGITNRKLYELQIRAIISAAKNVSREMDTRIRPEVMIPFVMDGSELRMIKSQIRSIESKGGIADDRQCLVGVMIEIPRAALLIEDFVKGGAEFISFGTNDLTQLTMGISRDDERSFMAEYQKEGILTEDPFKTLDISVLRLLRYASNGARKADPAIKIGVCGEHGGDPKSISLLRAFVPSIDYISCSPWRLPIAWLSSARASLAEAVPSEDSLI